MQRQLTSLDHFISAIDEGLRHAVGEAPAGTRGNPAGDAPDVDMDENTRKHVAGLMRINHAGEVCAQALYAGQAATARSETVRREMETAAAEEIDHLAWCAERLRELDDQPSVLNPLWYAGSFAIGAAAGLAGDAWSLGFLKETENQVEAHLAEHLDRLPEDDRRSNAILAQMKIDEARHADMAEQSGARDLPLPVTGAMRLAAGVMKAIVYRI
jgi:ubiquinone biosynthesis monooxygenase Coq7